MERGCGTGRWHGWATSGSVCSCSRISDGASMGFFSSERERRLWFWALAAVVAIYSTLGLAGTLAGDLRDRGLVENAFWLVLFLIGASVVTLALKTRPRGFEIGIAMGIAAVYLMVIFRMTIVPEERSHLVEYSVVAALVYAALLERSNKGRWVPKPALLAILATAIIGVVDELIQAVLPNRVFDIIDIGHNALAALMAVSASVILSKARRWGQGPTS